MKHFLDFYFIFGVSHLIKCLGIKFLFIICFEYNLGYVIVTEYKKIGTQLK